MRVLIFDTETTGLPTQRVGAKTGPNIWPHIVSISWMVLDSDTNKTLAQKSYIIKPGGWVIPEESTAIHGIMHRYAERYGADLAGVMDDFLAVNHDILVAHNLAFDENVILNAVMWDLGRRDFQGFTKPRFCTMTISRDMCRLPYPSGYPGNKPPKLSELYEHVFRKKPTKSRLHGSFYDTKILCDILKTCAPIRSHLGLSVGAANNTNDSHADSGDVLAL
jgi:DNA polymerase III epsilon subunit-like protein